MATIFRRFAARKRVSTHGKRFFEESDHYLHNRPTRFGAGLGWGTLAMINGAIAEQKDHNKWIWSIASLFFGPVQTRSSTASKFSHLGGLQTPLQLLYKHTGNPLSEKRCACGLKPWYMS